MNTCDSRALSVVPRSARMDQRYIREKIEAYNVAISALECHEAAEPEDDHLDFNLRKRLAKKLDREIQRWVDSLPNTPHETGSPKQ